VAILRIFRSTFRLPFQASRLTKLF